MNYQEENGVGLEEAFGSWAGYNRLMQIMEGLESLSGRPVTTAAQAQVHNQAVQASLEELGIDKNRLMGMQACLIGDDVVYSVESFSHELAKLWEHIYLKIQEFVKAIRKWYHGRQTARDKMRIQELRAFTCKYTQPVRVSHSFVNNITAVSRVFLEPHQVHDKITTSEIKAWLEHGYYKSMEKLSKLHEAEGYFDKLSNFLQSINVDELYRSYEQSTEDAGLKPKMIAFEQAHRNVPWAVQDIVGKNTLAITNSDNAFFTAPVAIANMPENISLVFDQTHELEHFVRDVLTKDLDKIYGYRTHVAVQLTEKYDRVGKSMDGLVKRIKDYMKVHGAPATHPLNRDLHEVIAHIGREYYLISSTLQFLELSNHVIRALMFIGR